MCSDTFGANPVNAFTIAASAIFSNASLGVPAVVNTLNGVPEFPYAQDGTSIPKSSRSARAGVVSLVVIFDPRCAGWAGWGRVDRTVSTSAWAAAAESDR